jgi:carbonic anhydrase/acetyltransferase-like protein (isoleucine patch superfamily)
MLVLGMPAKAVRALTEEERARIMASADHYLTHSSHYRKGEEE